jgi:hypothetical protein
MDIPIQVTSDESGPLLEIPVQIIDDPTMAAAEIHLNEVLMREIERAQNTETNIANNLAAEILRSTNCDTDHANAINVLNGDETTPGSVKKTVADEIAKVIAGAPESFDTLKELADWISYNETDAAGMNSRIIANKNAIDNEVVAARAAEDNLSTRITNEVSRATAAEQALGNLLQSYVDTIPEITIVANNIENVNDVADGISTINTLASDLTNVDIVAGSISNVNATGSDIANVNAVADDLTNVDILATSIANVDTVAASISDVNAVSSDIANVHLVASDLTNIDTVAGSIANVNTVSASIASVNAVATNISDITSASNDLVNIDAVAGAISTINTVAGDLTNVDILASSISDINSVSGSISDVTTVSASIADVSAVANNLSDIRAAVQSAEDAEAWAVGTIGGVPVSTSAEQHENNSKYYAELAESIASDMSSIEVTTMPTASAELANKVRIYIGQTTSTYTSGQSYQCIEDPENAGVYIWEPTASKVTVDNVTIQENASGQLETVSKIWNGSSAEWEALSSAEKSKWTIVNITDDADDTSTIETQIQALTDDVELLDGIVTALKADGAARANALPYEHDLGNAFTAEQSSDIRSGKFKLVKTGGYWTINGRKYWAAHADYRLHCGDTELTTHHMLVIPDKSFYNAVMNDSNVTTGGYYGSKMKTSGLANALATIKADFGADHVLTHGQRLTNAVANGAASDWAWYDSQIDLMNESMVYGHEAWSSAPGYDTGIDKSQLALFQARPDLITNGEDWWLRDVVSAMHFALVSASGIANRTSALNSYGVRPAFLIY